LIQNGGFQQSFVSGALGSLGASAFGEIAGEAANSTVGTIAFGAAAGGIGSELTGGNFWQGALIGGVVAGFNHVMHQIGDGDGNKIIKIRGRKYYANRRNVPAEIGNKLNALIGGDPDFWVEHQPYDAVEEHMMNEYVGTAAGTLAGGVAGKVIGRGIGVLTAETTTNGLTKVGAQFSKHSLERLAQRGVTKDMAKLALKNGQKFYDPLNKSINYVLPNGFASGKSLLVGTNPFSGEITTVIRSSKNLINKRFIPIK
jgi:uncharacterized protein YcfJ